MYTFTYTKLPVGRSRYVLMTDETGVIIDDGVACRFSDEHFYVTATTSGVDARLSLDAAMECAMAADVDVANVTAAYAGVNIAGPKSRRCWRVCHDIDFGRGLPLSRRAHGHGRRHSGAAAARRLRRRARLRDPRARRLWRGLWDALMEPVAPRRHPSLRRRGAARAAPGEGPHHRRPGHRRPDQSSGSRHAMGARQDQAVLRRRPLDRDHWPDAAAAEAGRLHPGRSDGCPARRNAIW